MAKRFIDSEIFKSPSIRALKAPYKLLWLYLVNDCDNAGIWVVDFDIAAIYLGREFNREEALKELGDKVQEIDDGKRWYLTGFVEFQYGKLNPNNNAHSSVIAKLERFKILKNKPLRSPSRGAQDMDKDMDKDKEKDARGVGAEKIYAEYPRKVGKAAALKAIKSVLKSGMNPDVLIERTKAFAAAVEKWPESDHQFIPHPATWFNQGRYEDEPSEWEYRAAKAPKTSPASDDPPPYPKNWKPILLDWIRENDPLNLSKMEAVNSLQDVPFGTRRAVFGR